MASYGTSIQEGADIADRDVIHRHPGTHNFKISLDHGKGRRKHGGQELVKKKNSTRRIYLGQDFTKKAKKLDLIGTLFYT